MCFKSSLDFKPTHGANPAFPNWKLHLCFLSHCLSHLQKWPQFNLYHIARVWSTITLRLCLQFLTISSCPPFYNPWIVPRLQEAQHMPQKTLNTEYFHCKDYCCGFLFSWITQRFPEKSVELHLTEIPIAETEIVHVFPAFVGREHSVRRLMCFVPPGWNNSSRKFSFLHPLLSYYTQVSSAITSHKKATSRWMRQLETSL